MGNSDNVLTLVDEEEKHLIILELSCFWLFFSFLFPNEGDRLTYQDVCNLWVCLIYVPSFNFHHSYQTDFFSSLFVAICDLKSVDPDFCDFYVDA